MNPKQIDIQWTDLPADRRRRLVAVISNLIQRNLSTDREISHECGTGLARLRVAGKDQQPS